MTKFQEKIIRWLAKKAIKKENLIRFSVVMEIFATEADRELTKQKKRSKDIKNLEDKLEGMGTFFRDRALSLKDKDFFQKQITHEPEQHNYLPKNNEI